MIDKSCHARLADFELLTTISDSATLSSFAQCHGGTTRWMSPELIDTEIQGYHRTKSSDRYALGMVIYEVLSGRVPFYQHADWSIPGKVVEGDRPERPQEAGEAWFTDAVWEISKRCWATQPENRPSIEDVLQCLKKASRTGHELLQIGDADDNDAFPFTRELPDPYHSGPNRPVSAKVSAPTDISQISSYNNLPSDGSPFTSVVVPSNDRLSQIPDKDEKVSNCTPHSHPDLTPRSFVHTHTEAN